MRRVPISADPRNELIGLYNQTLSVLSQLPPNAFYKNAAQAITQERLNLVQNTQDVEEIVRLTKVLQVEQLILEAQDELKLIEEVKETKP
jgi:NADH dehydrogenase (ubiquinone) 1 alpha subcomplex subunit 5